MSNYRFLDFELSESDFCLSRGGRRIPLEPKALRVLTLLISRAGRLVDKQELLESVWPKTFVEENTLTRTVAVLRRELGDSSRDSRLIETVPTRGYRFIAPVEVVPERVPSGMMSGVGEQAVALAERASEPESIPDSTIRIGLEATGSLSGGGDSGVEESELLRTGVWKLGWLLLAGVVFFAASLALWVAHRRMPGEQPIGSLAVLPLEDLSAGVKEDYFADGMTDALITELAQIRNLRVVSRTSVMQEKGARKPLARIAQELNVDAVVEGSVVRSGDRVRITAQLIDARSDKHLWAESFEGPLGDVLSLQDNVARDISMQTSAVLTPATRAGLASAKHIDPEAYDAYLQGLYFIQRRDGNLAVLHFRKAIALEPGYAAAHAGLAEALVTQFLANGTLAADIMPSAIAAAKRAIELDPNSGGAFTALGAIDTTYLLDWKAAEHNLRKGLELSPSSSDANSWLAVFLTSVGRPAESVDAMRRAVALDPRSFWANRLLGSMLYYSRRYGEALVALRRASELAPGNFQFVEGWYSGIYEVQGRYDDAVQADLREDATELSAGEVSSFRAAFASGGWRGYQKAWVRYLLPRSLNQCHFNSLAMSYLRLGERAEAFLWLNRDVDNRCGRTVFDLSADPRLDGIRGDPRFAALLRRGNLPY